MAFVVLTTTYTRIDQESDTWSCSSCGCEWTLNDGSPIDNNMHYCPECGAKITSVMDRWFDYEIDEYVEKELINET